MKIDDLSKELNTTNKELITFLNTNGFVAKSHNQNATNEMIDFARENYTVAQTSENEKEKKEAKNTVVEKAEIKRQAVNFKPDDMIPCRSVIPWEMVEVGMDKKTVYHWGGYGDIDYVKYSDLQYLRRKDLIKKPCVIIEDENLYNQWSRELGDSYKEFLGIEYPEEFFELSDAEFESKLKNSSEIVKEVIKVTALNMIRNQNYPSLNKLNLIDLILGTCLKEFL